MESIKCAKCGKEIGDAGCYNTPKGVFCCPCWEGVPDKTKDKLFRQSLAELAAVGRFASRKK